jgi:predicted transcriptional regulator
MTRSAPGRSASAIDFTVSRRLTRAASTPTLGHMEVHFSPDVETLLQQVASANGKDAEQLVKETVDRMLDNQARFIAGVQRGVEQADRGEFVEHKEVLNRIDRLFHS